MRKYKFISVITVIVLLVGILLPLNAFASSISNKTNSAGIFGNVEAEAIDTVTGAVTKLSVKAVNRAGVQYHFNTTEDQEPLRTETYEVIVNIPNKDLLNTIMPDDTESGSVTTDVTATLSIDYQLRNNEIRMDRVYGSWVPSSQFLTLSKREVEYSDGDLSNHHGDQHPSSNSFSYTTGWPYVEKYPSFSQFAPRAESHATVSLELSSHPIDLVLVIS